MVFVAHDGMTLRHLAVHPDRWGRGWRGSRSSGGPGRRGGTRLWCLVDNHRARAVYDHLG